MVRKRIERTANPLFLGAEHRGLQFLKSVTNEPKNLHLSVLAIKNKYRRQNSITIERRKKLK